MYLTIVSVYKQPRSLLCDAFMCISLGMVPDNKIECELLDMKLFCLYTYYGEMLVVLYNYMCKCERACGLSK